MFAQLINDI